MNSTLFESLTKVLQTVSAALPTMPVKTTSPLKLETGNHHNYSSHSEFSVEFLNSTARGNVSFVLEDDDYVGDSSSWLSIRLVVIACVLVGIVLMALGSYSIHRKWCSTDKHRLKYHRASLML